MLIYQTRLIYRYVEVSIPCILKRLNGEESRTMGQTDKGVGVIDIGMFRHDDRDCMLNTQSIDIVAEGNTVIAMDGVDNVSL